MLSTMTTRKPRRIAAGLAALCLAGGAGTVALQGGTAAQAATPDPAPVSQDATAEPAAETVVTVDAEVGSEAAPEGLASMSSPYIPGVPHVPSDVLLMLGPDGSADDARFVGPEGSLFNGPADEVEARVDVWWAEKMAAGLTPEQADALLAAHAE